jgi:prolyl-tRNA synthetase
MVTASTGESAVAHCDACGYGANLEKAERGAWPAPRPEAPLPIERKPTPGMRSVDEAASHLDVPADKFVKTLVYETDKGFVAVGIRGNRTVNEVKLLNALGVEHLQLASEDKVLAQAGAPVGSLGPVGLAAKLRFVADRSVAELPNFAAGANEAEAHFVNANWGRDAASPELLDLVEVVEGDPCPRCAAALAISRGIEVGHIFKLGDKYSSAMKCEFTDEAGAQRAMIMGCYGLGIGRTVAAAIEQNHDADGIIWPLPLAPFEVLVISLNAAADPAVACEAERVARELEAAGVEVLYDDRDERPGVKFKDADLIGIPIRATIGGKGLAGGTIEISLRRDRQKVPVPVADAVAKLLELRTQLSS